MTASGNNVEKYWPSLFAKALKGQDLAALLSSLGSGAVSAAPAQVVQTKAEEKPVEAKKEEKEDEDVLAGGIGFGDDDEW